MNAVNEYKSLPLSYLKEAAGYRQPSLFSPEPVRIDSPALEVMTDLKLVAAATIDANTHIDVANQAMIARGVRSLLVVDHTNAVVGLVTARDLLGERPMQFVRNHGVRHEDIRVRDIMTPRDVVEVLLIDDVLKAQVGHVVETLKLSGRQHALVVDVTQTGQQLVRGVFSSSQIARQLGIPMHSTEVARTFAEIEAAIARAGA